METSNSSSNYNLKNKGELLFPNLCSSSPVRLTVWCKSLLFHGDGYTVFDDSDGRIVFRVDNYSAHGTRWRNNDMVLMGPNGYVYLTIRHCKKVVSISQSDTRCVYIYIYSGIIPACLRLRRLTCVKRVSIDIYRIYIKEILISEGLINHREY